MSSKDEITKMQFVGSLITPRGTMEMLNVVTNLLLVVLSWFSITVEVFLRFSFGERYLSVLRLLLAYLTFQVVEGLYFLIVGLFGLGNPMSWFFSPPSFGALFGGNIHSFLYQCFLYGFFSLSAAHLITIAKRENDGQAWHTASFGISWLSYLPWELWEGLLDIVFLVVGRVWHECLRLIPVPLVRETLAWLGSQVPTVLIRSTLQADDWKFYRVLEPLLCYMLAQTLKPTDAFLSTWLLIASIALFLKNNLIYFEQRGRMLDLMDSHIESTYLQGALKREDKRKTAGFAVVPVPIQFAENAEIDPTATTQATFGQRSVHS